jgi:hypothetical protein
LYSFNGILSEAYEKSGKLACSIQSMLIIFLFIKT